MDVSSWNSTPPVVVKCHKKMAIPKSFALETLRLRLRLAALEDIPHVFSASQYPGFTDGMLWEPPQTMEELEEPHRKIIRAWEDDQAFGFTIEDRSTGIFLGRISIRPAKVSGNWNIGFWTHPEHQGRGIMSEAVQAVLNFGFEHLEAAQVEADYAVWNKASERVLQKNGMQFVRYVEQGYQKNGAWVAEHQVAISREEWKSLQAAN